MAEGGGEGEEGEEGFRTMDFSLGGRDLVVMRYVRVTVPASFLFLLLFLYPFVTLSSFPLFWRGGARVWQEVGTPHYDSL